MVMNDKYIKNGAKVILSIVTIIVLVSILNIYYYSITTDNKYSLSINERKLGLAANAILILLFLVSFIKTSTSFLTYLSIILFGLTIGICILNAYYLYKICTSPLNNGVNLTTVYWLYLISIVLVPIYTILYFKTIINKIQIDAVNN